jgi:microcin C transport system ATP-binding protein
MGQAILRLIDAEGSIHFAGEALQQLSGKQLRPLRRRLQVVFQDPFGSLSPRMCVEQIIAEGLQVHSDLNAAEREQTVIDVLRRSASIRPPDIATRTSFPAASASALPSPGRWCSSRR